MLLGEKVMFLSLSYFSTFFLKYSSADQLFLSPRIQTCWSTRKGHVIVIDVLDSSLDLSSYAFFRTVVFGGMIFRFSDIPDLLRSAGFDESCLPSLWFCSKELFALVFYHEVVGTWILIQCWRSIHSPYLNSICYL